MGRPPGPTGTGGQSGEPPLARVMDLCLWPAWRRVLPRLLTSVHGEVHERVAMVQSLCAAAFRPVGVEDAARSTAAGRPGALLAPAVDAAGFADSYFTTSLLG
jgi:hypothetical protein